jgi:hypothetical protein
MAKRTVIDFTDVKEPPRTKSGGELQMNKKQIRARARRHARISEAEFNKLYKPIEEWDDEELARGRPRSSDGSFRGKAPNWITREMHEEIMSRFRGIVESKMREETVTALGVIHTILQDGTTDDKGKPLVPASTKMDAAKFLIEHVVGKPTQRQEVDISVRLQALLATATVGLVADGAEALSLPPGADYESAFGEDEDEIEDADVVE